MKKKHILMFILFSLILMSLSCINAEDQSIPTTTDHVTNSDGDIENDVADTAQSQTKEDSASTTKEPVITIDPIKDVNFDENIELSGSFKEKLLTDRDVGGTLQIAFIYDENQKKIIDDNYNFDPETVDSCTSMDYYSFGDAPYTHMIVYDNNGNLGDFYAIDHYADEKYNFTYKAYTSGNIKVEVLYDYYTFDGTFVTIKNTTNMNVLEKTVNDEDVKVDNGTVSDIKKIVKNYKIKPHSFKKVSKVSYNTIGYNSPNRIILKQANEVSLSWINNLFNYEFNNKQILIYIDDILVYNGTVSDDSSEVLFSVLEEYMGEHLLKIVEANKTYQKTVTIV